jgi:hypothetical protein
LKTPWVGNIVAAVIGGAVVLIGFAVVTATDSRVTEVRVEGLKEAMVLLSNQVQRMDTKLDLLAEAIVGHAARSETLP